jgi:hypothetical protein
VDSRADDPGQLGLRDYIDRVSFGHTGMSVPFDVLFERAAASDVE